MSNSKNNTEQHQVKFSPLKTSGRIKYIAASRNDEYIGDIVSVFGVWVFEPALRVTLKYSDLTDLTSKLSELNEGGE